MVFTAITYSALGVDTDVHYGLKTIRLVQSAAAGAGGETSWYFPSQDYVSSLIGMTHGRRFRIKSLVIQTSVLSVPVALRVFTQSGSVSMQSPRVILASVLETVKVDVDDAMHIIPQGSQTVFMTIYTTALVATDTFTCHLTLEMVD